MVVQNIGADSCKKINLAASLAAAINQPRYKDSNGDFPLYPHAEGSRIQLKRSDNWHKHATATYNSPSNARVVCLCRDGANVLYWVPPIKGGKPIGLPELAGKYVFDSAAKAGIRQSINPRMYRWENAGLRCLVEPVVMSNIEELWVDIALFACPAYMQYYNMLVGLRSGQVSAAEFLYAILEREISTPSKPRTVEATFPLLRAIVAVSSPNAQISDFHKCTVRTNGVKAILETEAPGKRRAIGESPVLMQQIAETSRFGFAVCPVLSGDVTRFGLGDYKFDEKALSGIRDKILMKYGEKPTPAVVSPNITDKTGAVHETHPATVTQVAPPAVPPSGPPASDLEAYLNSLLEQGMLDSRIKLVLTAYAIENGASLAAEFEYFSAYGKQRYGRLFPNSK